VLTAAADEVPFILVHSIPFLLPDLTKLWLLLSLASDATRGALEGATGPVDVATVTDANKIEWQRRCRMTMQTLAPEQVDQVDSIVARWTSRNGSTLVAASDASFAAHRSSECEKQCTALRHALGNDVKPFIASNLPSCWFWSVLCVVVSGRVASVLAARVPVWNAQLVTDMYCGESLQRPDPHTTLLHVQANAQE
jgi:hypothetical protein